MSQLGRPSIWSQHAPEMQQMYADGKSRGEIARHFSTSVQTVTRMLTSRGVTLEDRVGAAPASLSDEHRAAISAGRKGKGTGARVVHESRTCEVCQTTYKYRPGKTGERFCSRTCRNTGVAADNQAQAQATYDAAPPICQCGVQIPFEHRHNRQFCSPECRATYQTKRQPNPDNYKTFDCQTCGKATTRYKGYGSGALMFCSNECAAKHTKVKKHYVVRDMDMVLDSGWECLFVGLCKFLKIPVERVDRSTAVEYLPGHWYAPDFHLPGLHLWVEVKGQEDPEDQLRWEFWGTNKGRLLVVDAVILDLLRKCQDADDAGHLLMVAI